MPKILLGLAYILTLVCFSFLTLNINSYAADISVNVTNSSDKPIGVFYCNGGDVDQPYDRDILVNKSKSVIINSTQKYFLMEISGETNFSYERPLNKCNDPELPIITILDGSKSEILINNANLVGAVLNPTNYTVKDYPIKDVTLSSIRTFVSPESSQGYYGETAANAITNAMCVNGINTKSIYSGLGLTSFYNKATVGQISLQVPAQAAPYCGISNPNTIHNVTISPNLVNIFLFQKNPNFTTVTKSTDSEGLQPVTTSVTISDPRVYGNSGMCVDGIFKPVPMDYRFVPLIPGKYKVTPSLGGKCQYSNAAPFELEILKDRYYAIIYDYYYSKSITSQIISPITVKNEVTPSPVINTSLAVVSKPVLSTNTTVRTGSNTNSIYLFLSGALLLIMGSEIFRVMNKHS